MAVVLACTSAVLFGACTVAIRLGLRRSPDPVHGALASALVALGVAVLAGAVSVRDLPLDEVWPFALAGLLAPGLSQILFVTAVGAAGPARVSVVVGAAPLVSVVLAVVFLNEPLETALVLGALLIVLGGLALVGERVRPADFRAIGAVLAAVVTVLFATRDTLVRWLAGETSVAPLAAASAAILAGAVVMVIFAAASWRRPGRLPLGPSFVALAPAGVLFGLSYVALFEAYERGRVSVVSPLVATESLWGVLISVLLLRRSELVGPRLVLGAVLVVAGGVLIGAAR
jgi:drug/metabolite transporter (DMT)-like permease